jgi:hypothetical protein
VHRARVSNDDDIVAGAGASGEVDSVGYVGRIQKPDFADIHAADIARITNGGRYAVTAAASDSQDHEDGDKSLIHAGLLGRVRGNSGLIPASREKSLARGPII